MVSATLGSKADERRVARVEALATLDDGDREAVGAEIDEMQDGLLFPDHARDANREPLLVPAPSSPPADSPRDLAPRILRPIGLTFLVERCHARSPDRGRSFARSAEDGQLNVSSEAQLNHAGIEVYVKAAATELSTRTPASLRNRWWLEPLRLAPLVEGDVEGAQNEDHDPHQRPRREHDHQEREHQHHADHGEQEAKEEIDHARHPR